MSAGPRAAAAGAALPARVTFGGLGRRIPPAFFGLSVEYNELQTYERSGVLFQRVMEMLRPQGRGPMTLRIGGKSADHMLWEPDPRTAPNPRKLPHGVFELGDTWLAGLAHLVRLDHLRLLLDLNLAVHSPQMAASFVSATRTALPARRVAGIEIGNEPDMYHYQPRLTRERVATTSRSTPLHWWSNYSSTNYRRDYIKYARTLRARVRGISLGAPDTTAPRPPWVSAMRGLGSLGPRFLAIHRYASSTCWPKSSAGYPTVGHLLSETESAGLARSVGSSVAFAHSRHMKLVLSEVNSVSCGGNAGVANSFATALWAPDALFAMIRAGVDSVSWHIRPWPINAPFRFSRRGIEPRPELYGLAMFARMTTGPANLLYTKVTGSGLLHLKAWAVRHGPTIKVLLINKGPRPARVSLRGLAHPGVAQVRRLSASSPHSTRDVRLAGMWIGSDARWHGHQAVGRQHAHGGYYHLVVPRFSAVLVTL